MARDQLHEVFVIEKFPLLKIFGKKDFLLQVVLPVPDDFLFFFGEKTKKIS